jgi:type II secretory pathway component PulC
MRPLNYKATTVDTNTDTTNEKKKTDFWKLTAVLLSDKLSVAVVNGQSLQLGDVLEGYTLMGIYKDRVVLNGKGRKFVLERSGTGLKKKSVQRK